MIPALAGAAVIALLFLRADSPIREGRDSKKKSPPPEPSPAPSASSFDKSWNTNPIIDKKPPPMNPPEDSEDLGPPIDPVKALQDLTDAICKKITSCPDPTSHLNQYGCVQGLLEYEGISGSFGINHRLTFQEVMKAQGRNYSAYSKALSRCLEGIKKFSCDDFKEKDLEKNPVDPLRIFPEEDAGPVPEKNPLAGIEDHFGEDETPGCEKIFKPKPVSCEAASSPIKIHSAAVQELVGTICSQSATCTPGLPCEACFQGVLNNIQFADKLGLNLLSLQAIDYGLALGLYSVNQEALGQCLAAMRSRGCVGAEGYWNPENQKSFSGSSAIIPRGESSCTKVFEKPRVSCDTGTADPFTKMAEALCGTVATCRPEIECDHCVSEVMKSEQIARLLGAAQKYYVRPNKRKEVDKITLQNMGEQIRQGKFVFDPTALEQCASDIQEQTCVKIQLGTSDYVPGRRDLVGGIVNLFSGGTGSCKLALKSTAVSK
jgi:hypothetical protein